FSPRSQAAPRRDDRAASTPIAISSGSSTFCTTLQDTEGGFITSRGYRAAKRRAPSARTLRDEDDVNGAEVWRRWLKDHLERRLDGLPRTPSPEELELWAGVVPLVGEFVPTAASFFNGRGIGFGKRPPQWELLEVPFAEHGRELVAFFTERIQNTTALGFMWNERVQQLVHQVRDQLGDAIARPLVEAAQRGGFLDPAV
ncbi:hypothetical protein, partial [Arachnia propionica]